MKKQYKNLVALLALALGIEARAALPDSSAPNPQCAPFRESYGNVLGSKEIGPLLRGRSKPELEAAFQQSLSDQDYSCITELLDELNDAQVPVDLQRPKTMTLASQEIFGGGQ